MRGGNLVKLNQSSQQLQSNYKFKNQLQQVSSEHELTPNHGVPFGQLSASHVGNIVNSMNI